MDVRAFAISDAKSERSRVRDTSTLWHSDTEHSVPVDSYFSRSLLAALSSSYERGLALSQVRGSRGRPAQKRMPRATRRSNGDITFEVRRLFCRPAILPFYGSASVVPISLLDLLSRAARP